MEVEWQTLDLAAPGPAGYAPTSGPIGEIISASVKRLGEGRMPALVWIRNGASDNQSIAVEENFRDERLCMALERFLCLRADVSTIPDRRLRERLSGHAPLLLLFDAAGSPYASFEGRRATSRGALGSRVELLWNRTFTMSFREYARRKDDVLDLKDQVERRRAALLAKLERAAGKPDKQATLMSDVEKLEGLLLKVMESARRLTASLRLQEKYRSRAEPEPDAD